MKKISYLFLFLLVSSVYAKKEKLPVISQAEELKTIKGKKIIWQKDGAKMVFVPENKSGTGKTEAVYDEFGGVVSEGEVTGATDSFFMDAYEVTVGQFKTFLKSSGYKPDEPIEWKTVYEYSPTEKHPMVVVSWHDATAYAKWAGKRLPTEVEWEYAARGGLEGKRYPWGDEKPDDSKAHYDSLDDDGGTTKPVGSFKPNGYGLYDMAGNVREWCQNWYDNDQIDKVLRGGSWYTSYLSLRLADRDNDVPNDWYYDYGFRCVSGLD